MWIVFNYWDEKFEICCCYMCLLILFCMLFLSAFTTTGFDCHTSPVFSPANPESSIEDCLAHLGEKVSQEMKEHLHKALEILLSKWVSISFLLGKVCPVSHCDWCWNAEDRTTFCIASLSFSVSLYLLGFFFCVVMCEYFVLFCLNKCKFWKVSKLLSLNWRD